VVQRKSLVLFAEGSFFCPSSPLSFCFFVWTLLERRQPTRPPFLEIDINFPAPPPYYYNSARSVAFTAEISSGPFPPKRPFVFPPHKRNFPSYLYFHVCDFSSPEFLLQSPSSTITTPRDQDTPIFPDRFPGLERTLFFFFYRVYFFFFKAAGMERCFYPGN